LTNKINALDLILQVIVIDINLLSLSGKNTIAKSNLLAKKLAFEIEISKYFPKKIITSKIKPVAVEQVIPEEPAAIEQVIPEVQDDVEQVIPEEPAALPLPPVTAVEQVQPFTVKNKSTISPATSKKIPPPLPPFKPAAVVKQVIPEEPAALPLPPVTAVEQVQPFTVKNKSTISAATSTKLPNLFSQPELPIQVLQAESVPVQVLQDESMNAPVQAVKTNPAVQAPIIDEKADTESVVINPPIYKRNTAQLLRELLEEINLKRDRNNKLIITEEEKQKFLERFNKIPSRNDPRVAGLSTTIKRSLEQASVPKAPNQIVPIRSPRVSNRALIKLTRNTNHNFERSKLLRELSPEIVALKKDIQKIKNNPSTNQARYTSLLTQIADILQRINELKAEQNLRVTIGQLEKSKQELLQTYHTIQSVKKGPTEAEEKQSVLSQAEQNVARVANFHRRLAQEPIGSLKQDVNKVKSEELPKRITELETIARNIHDLSIKKPWKISKETYITLKNKYNQLKSTVNTTLKSNKNATHINTLTKLVANNSKTIESKLKMNAIDNIIAQTALPGRNPIVAPKPAVKSAQLPKGPRNALAALLQEQATYSRMTPAQRRTYNAKLKEGKSGGTRKRNYTYKKK
jgi:hypothetical protein